MRVAFAGTPEFASAALRRLHAAGFEIPLVLTQPDRRAGRGMRMHASAVKAFAQAHGLPVVQPRSLRLDGKYPDDAQSARAALQQARPDVMVVAAYGLILPRWVLELPPLGCLNIHASLLPRWRGAAPIQRAIEAGDERTGITIMQMDEGLDTGGILISESVPITAEDTAATLHDRLAELGGRLIVEALNVADRNALVRTTQPREGVTYAHKIDKSEAPIDWSQSAEVIERRIRAFDPFPGASFEFEGEVAKVWRAAVLPGVGAPPGTALSHVGRLVIACGEGALELLELQRPGGQRLPARKFLHGRTRH
jgi:methionyl-tRNA formyltransferase